MLEPLEVDQEILSMILDNTKRVVESGKVCIPLVIARNGKEIHVICNVGDLKYFSEYIAPHLTIIGATECFVVNEAWMAQGVEARKKRMSGIPISQFPSDDRENVVSVIYCRKDGYSTQLLAIIDNKPDGRRLRAWQESEGIIVGSMVLKGW
jgi:hypothetical protein